MLEVGANCVVGRMVCVVYFARANAQLLCIRLWSATARGSKYRATAKRQSSLAEPKNR